MNFRNWTDVEQDACRGPVVEQDVWCSSVVVQVQAQAAPQALTIDHSGAHRTDRQPMDISCQQVLGCEHHAAYSGGAQRGSSRCRVADLDSTLRAHAAGWFRDDVRQGNCIWRKRWKAEQFMGEYLMSGWLFFWCVRWKADHGAGLGRGRRKDDLGWHSPCLEGAFRHICRYCLSWCIQII